MLFPLEKRKPKHKILNSEQDNTKDFSYYPNADAHLCDELRWLNRLIEAHVLRMRGVNFYNTINDLYNWCVRDDEVNDLLAEEVFESKSKKGDGIRNNDINKLLKKAQHLRDMINGRVQETIKRDIFLPQKELANYFNLSNFEQNVLLICLAPHIDARYEKLYAYLNNDITKKLPTIDLILALICHNREERWQNLRYFNLSLPLFHFYLIESLEVDSMTSATQHLLKADPHIVNYVLGYNVIDSRLKNDLRLLPSIEWDQVIIDGQMKNRLQKLFKLEIENNSRPPVFYLWGRSGVGKKGIARALCNDLNISLIVADMRNLLQSPENFQKKVRLTLREGLLQNCGTCFDHMEALEKVGEENPTLLTKFIHEIQTLHGITFLCSENPLPSKLLDLSGICPIKIAEPDPIAQKALWEIHLDVPLEKSEKDNIDKLISSFNLTGGQIERAVSLAKQSVYAHNPENARLTINDLLASARVMSQPKLGTMARKIEPIYFWNDIVLPQDQLKQLHELANQVKHQQMVLQEWGFDKKMSLGRGINALFTGASGTGKTMAADVIANDLNLDLYKIDLSMIVSKYIGETEKNLNHVFTEAENSNAILFFDEADALFGKRSEVKDAHDRYANIEIAYLLQKMEEYKGVTILATNLRQNIDDAFTRRIRFIIEFPFPEEEYRLRIWRHIFPKKTPLNKNIDFNFLSRKFKLAGGNIRNIALAAAFYAANDGQVVAMEHLILATRREFQKMGKLCVKSDFENYYDLV